MRPHLAALLSLVVSAPLLAEPAAMPEPVGAAGLLQVLAALGVVLGLFFLLVFIMRRLGGVHAGGSGPLRVIGGVSVGQRERVVLVQVGDRQLLLGVAPGRVNTLHVLDERVQPPAPAGDGERFAERLNTVLGRGGRKP